MHAIQEMHNNLISLDNWLYLSDEMKKINQTVNNLVATTTTPAPFRTTTSVYIPTNVYANNEVNRVLNRLYELYKLHNIKFKDLLMDQTNFTNIVFSADPNVNDEILSLLNVLKIKGHLFNVTFKDFIKTMN